MSNILHFKPSAPTTGLIAPESNALENKSTSSANACAHDFQKIMAIAQGQDPALVLVDPSQFDKTSDRQESAASSAQPEEGPTELLWTLTNQALQGIQPGDQNDSPGAHHRPLSSALTTISDLSPVPLKGIEVQGLKSTALSDRMTLITSDQPAPDEVSLGDFARQQGIDEKTLRWLMGTPASTPAWAQDAGGDPGVLRNSAVSGVDGTPLISGLSEPVRTSHLNATVDPRGLNDHGMASRMLLTRMSAQTGAEFGKLPLTAGLADSSAVPARPLSALNPLLSANGAPTTAPDLALVTVGQTSTLTFSPSHALPAMPAESSLEIGSVRAQFLTVNTPTQSALKAAQVDLDFSALLGQDGLAAWRTSSMTLQAGFKPSQTEGSLPTLDSALSNEVRSATELSTTHQGEEPAMGNSHGGQGSENKAFSSREFNRELSLQRSNTMTGQELADKMSLAIGKRLLEALERGEWQMKLNLKPADLGHVEVDLKMRGNVLEAHFTASQAITRDLLEGGMGRLKETLQQSGMDVASVKVNDGASSRSGGDSTPRQPGQGQNSELRNPKGETPSEPKIDGPIRLNSNGGLDLMV